LSPQAIHGPKNFKHESHVGWTPEGGFDINNIPAEWKKIFKSVGIKKADLQNNSELANNIFNIMQQASDAADGHSSTPATSSSAPAPPPPPVVTGPKPPPPPPVSSGPKPTPSGDSPAGIEETHQEVESHPAPEPPGTASSGGGSFLSQIAAGGFKLKTVDQSSAPPKAESSSGNSLADTLKQAMLVYRKDIEGDDKADEENDDWD